MGIFSLWFLSIAIEITDSFSFQGLDKYFNLHSSFMLIFKCIDALVKYGFVAGLGQKLAEHQSSSVPLPSQGETRAERWTPGSSPIGSMTLTENVAYITLIVGLTLDFPYLCCLLPVDWLCHLFLKAAFCSVTRSYQGFGFCLGLVNSAFHTKWVLSLSQQPFIHRQSPFPSPCLGDLAQSCLFAWLGQHMQAISASLASWKAFFSNSAVLE